MEPINRLTFDMLTVQPMSFTEDEVELVKHLIPEEKFISISSLFPSRLETNEFKLLAWDVPYEMLISIHNLVCEYRKQKLFPGVLLWYDEMIQSCHREEYKEALRKEKQKFIEEQKKIL